MKSAVSGVHTLVIGSGAAGLNAAVQLHARGIEDIRVITEGLDQGTSINAGSDKQTYYKLSLYGDDADAPRRMAGTYFDGGSMHGDLALVEAAVSPRAFLSLVDLGLPFPRDAFGQFVGYKTDHDPRQRATSIGPYTSREMCRALIRETRRRGIDVREGIEAVALVTMPATGPGPLRAAGAVVIDHQGDLSLILSENTVLAVGGPGGLYRASVYPAVHAGAIGLALRAGVTAQGLPESQYGMASTAFRWNVSGTYMQGVPRFLSTDAGGKERPVEFMRPYFETAARMHGNVFLKGYQWPFDARKVSGGSSIVDLLVYLETVIRGRRVFLDYRENPQDFAVDTLDDEARQYLERCDAGCGTPLDRLHKMNPGAIDLYREHGIDLAREPLEIAVCAQHNNGGLAGNAWWESVNVSHLFPVGEVNGSHGVYRPGGAALNAGQVGAIRAAEFIANRYREWTLDRAAAGIAGGEALAQIRAWLERGRSSRRCWKSDRTDFQDRMSRAGAHIRRVTDVKVAVGEAWRLVRRIDEEGYDCADPRDCAEALRNRHLAYAHAVYLDAVRFALDSGVGSRGSAIVVDPEGQRIHQRLDDGWAIRPEDESFRGRVMETRAGPDGRVGHEWVSCRPIPEADAWFETAWAAFRQGDIYRTKP